VTVVRRKGDPDDIQPTGGGTFAVARDPWRPAVQIVTRAGADVK